MAVLRVGGTIVLLRQFTAEAFWRAYLGEPQTSLLALTPNLLATALRIRWRPPRANGGEPSG